MGADDAAGQVHPRPVDEGRRPGVDDLRPVVVDDPRLRERLLQCAGTADFVAEVMAIAEGLGIAISPDDVTGALEAERRRRQQRWV